MGKQIFNHLPEEIIEEILYNLPVKSLLRFKCASKSWRSSISSEGFITEHLNKVNTGTDFTHHKLVLIYREMDRTIGFGSCCIGSLLNHDGDDEPIDPSLGSNLSIPIPSFQVNSFSSVYLLGSCNGLTLISIHRKELYLWNPSTRKARNVVHPEETLCWNRSLLRSTYGFGYDESTDDYKVACFLSVRVRVGDLEANQIEVYMYGFRANSWKTTENFDGGFMPEGTGKFVNGKLHWLAYKGEGRARKSWCIVSLGLVKGDKCRIMAAPSCISDCDYPVLGDLGGYFSLIRYDHISEIMDVWVMKKQSWSKIWTISDRIGYCPISPKPLWLKENGDIVVALGSSVVIYRGKDKLRQYSVDDMFNARIESIVYVESLVSPFPIWGWQY